MSACSSPISMVHTQPLTEVDVFWAGFSKGSHSAKWLCLPWLPWVMRHKKDEFFSCLVFQGCIVTVTVTNSFA